MRVTPKNEHRYNIEIIRLEIEINHDKDGEDSKKKNIYVAFGTV